VACPKDRGKGKKALVSPTVVHPAPFFVPNAREKKYKWPATAHGAGVTLNMAAQRGWDRAGRYTMNPFSFANKEKDYHET
jgi:hypothetical protein